MFGIFSKFFDLNQREINRLSKIVEKINSLEAKVKKLKDEDFAKKTQEFKERIDDGESLESLLPEAFALVREASWRSIGLRPYDVQLMAGIALFEGKVVEQKTGEGKTLSAVAPLYLRSLERKGVHLVTVNDYLARRDAGWNGPTFSLLGLSVSAICQEQKSYLFDLSYEDKSYGDERLSHLKPVSRKEAYMADVTYGTNNEFGFDYLRDNMVSNLEEIVQTSPSGGYGVHHYAIIDEVDSILIDEARTPLIISAPDTEPTGKYYEFAQLVEKLNPDTDFVIDEKYRSATLTEHGIKRVEKILGVENLYEKDWETIHHIENALRAKTLYLKDRDYIVKDNEVIIVDEFTGRLMPGRRWSDGLHQAVEAKENVPIKQESKTLATISFQNYFRMYKHLAGMTGTAATEAEEFKTIYNLDVVVIPTHKPMIRKDYSDVIYKSLRAKYGAIVKDIEERIKKGQPVLVGTTSIEKNEIISSYLKKKGIPHNVLNAKNHEKEALIIAEAGKPGAVTVATNMAGRGVDIILGGTPPHMPPGVSKEVYEKSEEYQKWKEAHDKVVKSGGLHVIGTERHESRRIDNQLRGRAGRQGDPGSSRFYLSLEDDLMRIFGGESIAGIMERLNIPEDQPIENSLISKAIEQAQTKVEGFNFDIRKRLVEYDDVANQQREVIYSLRRNVLEKESLKDDIFEILEKRIDIIVDQSLDQEKKIFDKERILAGFLEILPVMEDSWQEIKKEIEKASGQKKEELKRFLVSQLKRFYEEREKRLGLEVMRQIERFAYLGAIDKLWIDHIDHIEGLRETVTLRAYGQKDPLVEFKNEAYLLFEQLIERIEEELSRRIFRIEVVLPGSEIPLERAMANVDTRDAMGLLAKTEDETVFSGQKLFSAQRGQVVKKKIGRNDPCWCGSGKKWKKCHYPQLSP